MWNDGAWTPNIILLYVVFCAREHTCALIQHISTYYVWNCTTLIEHRPFVFVLEDAIIKKGMWLSFRNVQCWKKGRALKWLLWSRPTNIIKIQMWLPWKSCEVAMGGRSLLAAQMFWSTCPNCFNSVCLVWPSLLLGQLHISQICLLQSLRVIK